jgi:hypothetical protein
VAYAKAWFRKAATNLESFRALTTKDKTLVQEAKNLDRASHREQSAERLCELV